MSGVYDWERMQDLLRQATEFRATFDAAVGELVRELKLVGLDVFIPNCLRSHTMTWDYASQDCSLNCSRCEATLGLHGQPYLWRCNDCTARGEEFYLCAHCGKVNAHHSTLHKLQHLEPAEGWNMAFREAADASTLAKRRADELQEMTQKHKVSPTRQS